MAGSAGNGSWSMAGAMRFRPLVLHGHEAKHSNEVGQVVGESRGRGCRGACAPAFGLPPAAGELSTAMLESWREGPPAYRVPEDSPKRLGSNALRRTCKLSIPEEMVMELASRFNSYYDAQHDGD